MAARKGRPNAGRGHWILSGLLLVAIGIAAAGMSSVVVGVAWWFMYMAVTTAVLLAAAIVRSTARGRVWASVAGVGAAVASVTLMFAPGTALVGFIPTFATFGAFHELEIAGTLSIASQSVPASAEQGIVYLMCLGAAAIALAADTVAHQFRLPALVGVPLLVLVLVPSFVQPQLSNALVFVLTAVAWLAIMLLGSRPRGFAIGTSATAVVAALLLPLVLPGVQAAEPGRGGNGVLSGINPIVTLGDDLRRGDPALALSYTTSGPGQYLRLTALDDFSGPSWGPTNTDYIPENSVLAIGAAPGLGVDVPANPTVTEVTIANILSRWLPVPYASTSITGLNGDWSWEPDGLTIRTESANARNQVYEVSSVQIAPSIEQLVGAGTTVEPGLERYLEIPGDLPAIVRTTAAEVVAGAATNYDKAIALQKYFRDGDFTYSLDAPVEQDFDGSGAAALGDFLEVRAGYCVHFSSAMAAMARTLGIPARVVVGFTPGEQTTVEGSSIPVFRVTTDNLHAWPELFFAGIGWVRFEPTPGRGSVPVFALASVDDPSTPDVDESVPVAAPVPTAAPTSAPNGALEDTPNTPLAGGPDAAGSAPLVVWPYVVALLLALLATPWALRALRRRSRLAAARSGSARAAWDELRSAITDLGFAAPVSRTPRQLADDLGPLLDDGSRAALTRLTAALEGEVFAGAAGSTTVPDLLLVLRGLRRGATPGARAAATLLPRSLVGAWLPARLTAG